MDKASWKNFGLWVDLTRTELGLGVGELAEKANVSQQWLQTLRKGGRTTAGEWKLPTPKDDALARLAHALNVPVAEIMNRAGREVSDLQPVPENTADRIKSLEEKLESQGDEISRLRDIVTKGNPQAEAN